MKVKAGEIRDADISFVSLVKKAANRKKFLVCKAEDGKAAIDIYAKIIKADTETHHITGVVYAPDVEDTDGNFMTAEEIRKAAYRFAKSGGKNDLNHSMEAAEGVEVVESYVAPCDMQMEGEPIAKGTWLMTVEVENDEVWGAVEKGDITGFSMGGSGVYVGEESSGVEKAAPEAAKEKHGILKAIAGLFGYDVVEKGEVAVRMERSDLDEDFWNAQSALRGALTVDGIFISDIDKIKAALNEYSDIILNLLTKDNGGDTESNVKKEENELNKEEVQALITEQMGTLKEEIKGMVEAAVKEKLKKPDEPAEDGAQEGEQGGVAKSADVEELIKSSIAAAMEPILKAHGLPSNLEGEQAGIAKGEQHYLAGIL